MKKIKLITKLTSLTLIGASCSSLIVINTSCSKNEPSSLEIMKNYFNTHKSILPNPGTTNWTTDTQADMITWFNNNVTAQNYINYKIFNIIIMLDEGMLDIELLNFDYKQIDINNITIDMTTKVTTDNVTEQAIQRSVLSVTYVSNKFNLVETLYQQGLDPIITHTNNLTITKINQRTDQMIGPYIAIYLNNETTPRNFLLAPVETENVISKVPQPTE